MADVSIQPVVGTAKRRQVVQDESFAGEAALLKISIALCTWAR
jgi:hypothetical protein